MSRKRKAETQASLAIGDETSTILSVEPATGRIVRTLTDAEQRGGPAQSLGSPTPSNTRTLASLAKDINARFDAIASYDASAYDARIAAGKALAEARERVDASPREHGSFAEWCAKHIKRSKTDIYRCIKLATADDPAEAREAEKAVAREGMARTRATQQAVIAEANKAGAVARLESAKPAPQASIWDKVTTGLPASTTRDTAIATQSAELDRKSGSDLATHIETQVRLLTDVKWSTISEARRGELVRLVRKMIERIELIPGC